MEIEEKLKMSQSAVAFFIEGPFLKVYNESFYVLSELLDFKLKPIVKYIKKIDRVIIYGGFPCAFINKRYPNATPMPFGYRLTGDYDLSGYPDWYQQASQQAMNDYNKAKTDKIAEPLTAIFPGDEPINPVILSEDLTKKPLTAQHLLFLSSWQANKYPYAVDRAFIQDLKNYFKV